MYLAQQALFEYSWTTGFQAPVFLGEQLLNFSPKGFTFGFAKQLLRRLIKILSIF
jgi:hypothetical protein